MPAIMPRQILEPIQLMGITRDDIQAIFEETIKRYRGVAKVIWLDASYLYTFDLSDFAYIRHFNLKQRHDKTLVLEWHRNLERWLQDQTVTMFGKPIKPSQITRTFDRIPNEGLEHIAMAYTGAHFRPMAFHAIGIGAEPGDDPLPSDRALLDELSRIDVRNNPDGGSLSTEGSTIFIVANHPISTQAGAYTESGVFDSDDETNDIMGDHSIFPDEIEHDANQNAIGGSTIIYQCSA